MKLCSKMAHVCLGFLKKYPELNANVDEYFDYGTARYGYHASQLKLKHGIKIWAVASRMSAFLNNWLDMIDKLDLPDYPKLIARLKRCAHSYSDLSRNTMSCGSVLCPMCRAVQVMRVVYGCLPSSGARCCIITDATLSDVPPSRRPAPECVLTLKMPCLSNSILVRRTARFYQDTRSVSCTLKQLSKIAKSVMSYDFGILNRDYCSEFLKYTRGQRMFTERVTKCCV